MLLFFVLDKLLADWIVLCLAGFSMGLLSDYACSYFLKTDYIVRNLPDT